MPKLTYLKLMLDKLDALEDLPDEEVGKLVKALMQYEINGTMPEKGSVNTFAFKMFKPQIDADIAAYDELCQKNAENAKKGGRPRNTEKPNGSSDEEENPGGSQDMDKKPSGFSENRTDARISQIKSSQVKSSQDEDEQNTAAATARARENAGDSGLDPQNAIGYVSLNINEMTDNQWHALYDYQKKLSDELICYAVDETVGAGHHNWGYLRSILDRLVNDRIKTVAQDRAQKEARTAAKPPSRGPRQIVNPFEDILKAKGVLPNDRDRNTTGAVYDAIALP